MNESPDPLEVELSALRPRPISPNLRRRIAERLAEPTIARSFTPWRMALAGGLIGACATALFFALSIGRRAEPERFVAQRHSPEAAEVEDTFPTLLQYDRALAHSPEELNALLDRSARIARGRNIELAQVSAFTQSDEQVHALLGEN